MFFLVEVSQGFKVKTQTPETSFQVTDLGSVILEEDTNQLAHPPFLFLVKDKDDGSCTFDNAFILQ